MHSSEIRKIAFVGDYLPRKCGIATFTHDMYASVSGRFPDAECFVVPINDRPEGYDYPPEVRFEIDEPDLESYRRAAGVLPPQPARPRAPPPRGGRRAWRGGRPPPAPRPGGGPWGCRPPPPATPS